jgi:hypothetical protein
VTLAPQLRAQTENGLQKERERFLASPLYQRILEARGNLQTVRKANPANLYANLASLVKSSEYIFVAHINWGSSTLSPSGSDVLTMYEATVIQQLKGRVMPGRNFQFSVPVGVLGLDAHTTAAVSVQDFLPPERGKRYLLCIRYAHGDERQLTPGMRLTGDAVQGIFELDDEQVVAGFREDPFWQGYHHAPVSALIKEVRDLVGPYYTYYEAPPESECRNGEYCDLSAKLLQSAGFHLPSYEPSAMGFGWWQRNVTRSQELTIYWDSLPGQPDVAPFQQVQGLPLSKDFVLKSRVHNIARGAGLVRTGLLDFDQPLIIVGITTAGQVRGLWDSGDPRVRAEGSQVFAVQTRVEFKIYLPDDPQMKTLVFLKSENTPSGWTLTRIGSLDLSSH